MLIGGGLGEISKSWFRCISVKPFWLVQISRWIIFKPLFSHKRRGMLVFILKITCFFRESFRAARRYLLEPINPYPWVPPCYGGIWAFFEYGPLLWSNLKQGGGPKDMGWSYRYQDVVTLMLLFSNDNISTPDHNWPRCFTGCTQSLI